MSEEAMKFLLLALAAVVIAACNESGQTNMPSGTAAVLNVDSVPVLDLGASSASDSARVIGLPTGATRLSNGVIAVADDYLPGVRYFRATGEPLHTTGGRGGGPKEFRGLLNWLGQCGPDSVFVWDAMAEQISVLDTAGSVVRRYRLEGNPGYLSCSRSGLLAVFADPKSINMPSESAPRDSGEMTLRNAEGAVLATVGRLPYAENRPLGRLTRFALTNDALYVGTADSAFIDVYDHAGKHTTVLAVGREPGPPTRSHYEHAIDAMIAPLTERDFRQMWRDRLLKIPMPDRMPPYSAILTDPAGRLWVVTSFAGDGKTRFRVISADGGAQDVTLPRELTVFEVGADYILGAYEAVDGEQRVAMYQLRDS